MKRMFLIALLSIGFLTIQAQEVVEVSHYVFPDFVQGVVLKTDGTRENAPLNYNAITQEMIFKTNGKSLALSDLSTIDTVLIQDKKFVPVNGKFYEVLMGGNLPLYIQHVSNVEVPGAPIGYGASTQTSGVTALSSLPGNGSGKAVYDLKLPDNFKVTPSNVYFLKINNVYIKVSNQKQFLKAFPEKEKLIKQYVSEKHPGFDNATDFVDLLTFISRQ